MFLQLAFFILAIMTIAGLAVDIWRLAGSMVLKLFARILSAAGLIAVQKPQPTVRSRRFCDVEWG